MLYGVGRGVGRGVDFIHLPFTLFSSIFRVSFHSRPTTRVHTLTHTHGEAQNIRRARWSLGLVVEGVIHAKILFAGDGLELHAREAGEDFREQMRVVHAHLFVQKPPRPNVAFLTHLVVIMRRLPRPPTINHTSLYIYRSVCRFCRDLLSIYTATSNDQSH